ncbi:PadR family transcriptional regulator [uncultured Dubosiella sp.]|uniref:PadR family transcriptional regulator n=1 Tax=uncultured Dubosiella sp. TaxID=1937011 RepID=UPI002083B2EF|nr:PadR family transcriptional regulator [uncultured Dubosiella sp.]GJM56880.1 PadR family transcriptional regulator [Erysipelotrichaceae bacterium OPF54]
MSQDLPLTETLYYILLVLHRPMHGYKMAQEVETMTQGRVVLGAGTLYGAIKNLLKKGWIRVYRDDQDARRKKEYILTEEGKNVFEEEVKRLEKMLEDAKKAGQL